MSDHAFPAAADGGDSQGPVFCRTTTERPVHGLLSVVIPCHNEEEVIEATHARLAEVLPATALEFEIIYIDDEEELDEDACGGAGAEERELAR